MSGEAARSDDPARVRSLAAAARQREGRLDEACALFERAGSLAPSDPDSWAALAGCLLLARPPQAAMAACQAGLSRPPQAAVLHIARPHLAIPRLRSLSAAA